MVFAWTNAAVRRGVLTAPAAVATTISVSVGLPVFAVALLASGNPGSLFQLSTQSIAVFAVVGVSHFIVGRGSNYRALRAIGTGLAGSVMQFNVLISLGLAVFFLGEAL